MRSSEPERIPSRSGLLLPGLFAAVPIAYLIAMSRVRVGAQTAFPLFDDAMISMTYARTLAEGHGLIWYPGAEAVEGFTNLLWTLWMAVLHAVLGDGAATSLSVIATGFLAIIWTLRSLQVLASEIHASSFVTTASLCLTGACVPLGYWTGRGMEVGACAALVAAMCVEMLRFLRVGGAVGATKLAILTVALFALRPEMLALISPAWGFGLCFAAPGRHRRQLVAGGAMVAVAVGAITLWRYSYYGDVFPNTFYLKAMGANLSARLQTGLYWFCNSIVFYLFPLLLPTIAGLRRLLTRNQAFVLMLSLVAIISFYSIWIGGDAWEADTKFPNRYLSCMLPLLFLCAAAALEEIIDNDCRRPLIIALGLMLAAAVYATFPSENSVELLGRFSTRQPVAAMVAAACAGLLLGFVWTPSRAPLISPRAWRYLFLGACASANVVSAAFAIGSHGFGIDIDQWLVREAFTLRANLPPTSTVAVTYAGSTCYYSRLRCVDLYGKSDKFVARLPAKPGLFRPGHNKFDLDHSLGVLKPDYVASAPAGQDLARYGYGPVRIGDYVVHRRVAPPQEQQQKPRSFDAKGSRS